MGVAILVALGWLALACLAGVVVSRLGEAGGAEDAHRVCRSQQETVSPTRRPSEASVVGPAALS
jgi:hypothetical protein